ncbi:MAG: phosphoesterase [bacterium]|nr:phosphoesterase [bacterium]
MSFDLAGQLAALKQRANGGRAAILTHDNPDPDSLAAAMGLRKLFEQAGLPSTITIGGIIGRAENRAMVRELKIELVPIEKLDWSAHSVIAMVDTQPGTGNNSLPSNRNADVVIDHHPPRHDLASVPWLDIRTEMGATATIVYGYLEEQQIPIDPMLATAFLYALKSETRDLGRESGPDERDAYVELSKVADFERLYCIQNPKLGREHFVALDRALRSAVVWGELLAINLGALDYPDLVAEVADLMLPYEKAHWVMCVGQHNRTVFLSVRTDINDATAGALIRRVVGSNGAAGGHGMIAGGRMFAEVRDEAALKSVYDELVARLVRELKIAAAPSPLL